MIPVIKQCLDCRQRIRVFPGDDIADCENKDCGESFRVIRENGEITLRHLYFRKRPQNETRLEMFESELLV